MISDDILAGKKRTFRELQKKILQSLKNGPKTINEISLSSGVNWNSTAHQLILLKGSDKVSEIFKHKRLRLFEITKIGREELR